MAMGGFGGGMGMQRGRERRAATARGLARRRPGAPDRSAPVSATAIFEAEIPEQAAAVAREVFGDRPLRLRMAGDMLPSGAFGRCWLLMSDTHLAVVAWPDGETPHCSVSFLLSELSGFEVVSGVSTAALQCRHKADRLRLMRFSNARHRDFAEGARLIDAWIARKEWRPEVGSRNRSVCSVCGRPLPKDLTVCPSCVNKRMMLRKVLAYLRPYRTQAFQLMLLMLIGTVIGLVNPYVGKVLVDDVLKPLQNQWLLAPLAGAMLLVYVLGAGIEMLSGRISARIGSGAIHDVRHDMFLRLQELSLSFYARHSAGALVTRVAQDTQQLQHLLVDFVPYGVSSVLMAVGILVLLFTLSWQLTLFVLVPVTAMILFVTQVFPRFHIFWTRCFERRSRLAAFVNDAIHGVRVVKAFAKERDEMRRFDTRSAEYRDALFVAEAKWANTMPLLHLLAMVGTPLVWLVGGMLAFKGRMTLGTIVAYSGYLGMLFRPVFTLTRLAQMVPNALAAAGRVFDIIETEPEIVDAPDAIAMPRIEGRIEFRDVTFGYDRSKPVLHNVSFDVKPRETIGLVGKSGAGKSTTINLVCRFFDVDDGQILVDGVDIRKIRYRDLRGQIGIVLQETFLFSGTIAENIGYARADATIEDIVRAAKAANAHTFILAKPDGYDTQITEAGENLSVGEKQRIAIARAILCDPRILILDEATASVDLETEKEIQDALARLTSTRTTLAIAHRLSTLKNAHRLVVLDNGRVVETGTHADLEARDGVYAKLVRLQRQVSQLRAVAT